MRQKQIQIQWLEHTATFLQSKQQMEIVSSKKNKGFYHSSHRFNLLGHAWNLYKEGKSLQLIDDVVWESCYLIEVLRLIHVGLLCVQESPEDRPSMSSVVMMLCSEGALP
ncbi:hypothetical protein CsSME_00035982 [Camellia sinensis var. sinensis]